ncbi:hypothetical protein AALO_G00274210 [Alosa alosa]|uniref:Arginine vasotocin receptor n=1 Tax=Alosa alosa TaxID=278164 RepID=A0AAV6FHU7_9TELE|nr:hypothetical protein AALO_G00274210 [Alosa alosa]
MHGAGQTVARDVLKGVHRWSRGWASGGGVQQGTRESSDACHINRRKGTSASSPRGLTQQQDSPSPCQQG